MTESRPEPGTPEFEQWLLDRAKKRADRIFTVEIPEDLAHVDSGIMAGPGSWKDIMPEKTIAEDIAIDKAHKRKHLKVVK
ncbi:hypothetical protein [Rheinheimera nanhaiensis]|uniref:Uncharacterized protein n=1 Tax=Rheinheimera nanhaiensis E407-8 TaxID=562729 RepID=I1DW46_9GAMM|nr:hypothetical protein [Rheinheimera nanhaiensis]GAB58274.1 hypothetical protein RNAN_1245 [Rheinheimera nanhaiensis E407-8]